MNPSTHARAVAILVVVILGAGLGPGLGGCEDSAIDTSQLSGATVCEEKAQPGEVCISSVTGTLSSDGPLPSVVVSVCGRKCYYGRSLPDGRFTVDVNSNLPIGDYAAQVHGEPEWLSYYVPLPGPVAGKIQFKDPLPLVPVPATTRGMVKLDGSAQQIAAGDATLVLAAGTHVELPPEAFTDAPETELLFAKLDRAALPFGAKLHFSAVILGTVPFETTLSSPAGLTFPNSAGWAAGSSVVIATQRGLLSGLLEEGAAFDEVARARVSADGTRVETEIGQGIKTLSWIAAWPAQ